MAKRTICSLFSLVIFILLPVAIHAQLPPHNSSNAISCRDCHDYIIQGGIFKITVPRGAEQETVCKNCHNSEGQASSMSSVGNHLVNGGDIIIDCGSCLGNCKSNQFYPSVIITIIVRLYFLLQNQNHFHPIRLIQSSFFIIDSIPLSPRTQNCQYYSN